MKNIIRKIKSTLLGLVIAQALLEIYLLINAKNVKLVLSKHNFGISVSMKKEEV